MDAPSEKTQKYDRQLRLWGERGQALLESCKLCLINATATGCEILKNLILPGIGSFSIIDELDVVEEDLGNNFFMTSDSLGKKRGQVATQYLKELNEDVTGEFIDENLEGLLKRNPEVFLKYNMVVVTALPRKTLLALTEYLWAHDIPVVICRSYGMLGYLRLVTNNHTVIETHPEHPHPDLRVTNPFSELVHFCDSIDLEKLSKKDHSHLPWLVILYKYLQEYRSQHDGQVPTTYKEKKTLKDMIRKGIRHNEAGVPEDEENFDEAIIAVNTALHSTASAIPSTLRDILDHPYTSEINSESSSFWILARALRGFIEVEGDIPLPGAIPDMTADSKSYISLQQIYRNKSTEHVEKVYKIANEIKDSIEGVRSLSCKAIKEAGEPSEEISVEEARLFCRNAANLAVIHCGSLNTEYDSLNTAALEGRLGDDEEGDDAVYYVLLRASEEFYTEYSRYPGSYDDQVEADITLLKAIASRLLSDAGMNVNLREDYIHEFCSYGASELHTISAFMGGVAAQEVIKLITKQYIPINNTYIYNASSQTSVTLKM